ncbi:hypothetical protein BpHYR1_023472 [Brachionus plicatilis]|uniref:Uncharacterized protein n=1 Tax=Brachionus plicatilis TaxID=10195 RepID=A0A3M7QAI3_BRAPC|nr:hypothetical protein BpHYR1_023472 [Brachionus plicatilis]
MEVDVELDNDNSYQEPLFLSESETEESDCELFFSKKKKFYLKYEEKLNHIEIFNSPMHPSLSEQILCSLQSDLFLDMALGTDFFGQISNLCCRTKF